MLRSCRARLALCLALLVLLSGCASIQRAIDVQGERRVAARMERCQSEHPEWEESVCRRTAAGELWIGMTKEQLLFSWGKPTKIRREGAREHWVYSSRALGTDRSFRSVYLQPTGTSRVLRVVAYQR